MTFYADKHELFDGDILLYRRQSPDGEVHPVWQARLKVAGRVGYVTKSCRTKNYDDARAYAKAQLFALQHKVKNGIPIKDWTFEDHCRTGSTVRSAEVPGVRRARSGIGITSTDISPPTSGTRF